jgi:Ni/Co efflux regulator RcnB
MKYVLAFFAAAVLAMPATAEQQHSQPHPGGGGMGRPAMHAPAMHAARPAMHPRVAARRRTMHHTVHRHVTHHVVHHVSRHTVHHAVRAAARPGHRAPRAAVVGLRKNVVAVHRFHAGPYRAPRGYAYRRWVFGERLPGIYFAPAFWITDFLAFDLFAPPDGYVWVRYGPDALLIDQYTGEIIQVDYGVFY